MPHYVLDARIYFTDIANAQNAYDHIKALAEHSAAHDVVVGAQTESSWARLHDCRAVDNAGDTSLCANITEFVLNEVAPGEEVIPWAIGQSVAVGNLREYGGIVYSCVQAHTTTEGWEPPNTPALWSIA